MFLVEVTADEAVGEQCSPPADLPDDEVLWRHIFGGLTADADEADEAEDHQGDFEGKSFHSFYLLRAIVIFPGFSTRLTLKSLLYSFPYSEQAT